MVTGLVPVEKQELAYIDAFKSAVGYDPNKDVPEYWGYQVQRMEVASPGEAADPDWEKADKPFIFPKDAQKVMEKWANAGTEVVAPEYVNEMLVFALGPLEGRPWGESVGHPQDIPIQKVNQLGVGMGPGLGPGPGLMPPGIGGGNGGVRDPRTMPREPIGPGPGNRTPPAGDNPFGGQHGGPGATGPGVPGEPNPAAEAAKPPAFLLFRYFDYNVEPGKHYVYRVRLGLRNPNCDKKPADLKDPELAKAKYVATKWSDPSPVISVPRETARAAGFRYGRPNQSRAFRKDYGGQVGRGQGDRSPRRVHGSSRSSGRFFEAEVHTAQSGGRWPGNDGRDAAGNGPDAAARHCRAGWSGSSAWHRARRQRKNKGAQYHSG